MLDQDNTRFNKAEDALRFFFRLHELLYSRQTEKSPGVLAVAELVAGDALDDYRSIECSMRVLDEVALWMLGQLYGPTALRIHRRAISDACRAGLKAFPRRQLGPREILLIHERALGVVKRGLRELGMIPAPSARSVRDRRLRVEKTSARLCSSPLRRLAGSNARQI